MGVRQYDTLARPPRRLNSRATRYLFMSLPQRPNATDAEGGMLLNDVEEHPEGVIPRRAERC